MTQSATDLPHWTKPLGIAIACELIYIGGRDWLLDQGAPSVRQELTLDAWRFLFIPLYLALYRRVHGSTGAKRWMPRHPALLLAVLLIFVVPPFGAAVAGPAYLTVLTAVTFPIAVPREELFDHGILQASLERSIGPMPAIVVTVIAFTLAHHGVVERMDPAQLADIATTGVVLGVIYQRTRNLPLVIAIHLLCDEVVALAPRPALDVSELLLLNLATGVLALAWWRLDSRAAAR